MAQGLCKPHNHIFEENRRRQSMVILESEQQDLRVWDNDKKVYQVTAQGSLRPPLGWVPEETKMFEIFGRELQSTVSLPGPGVFFEVSLDWESLAPASALALASYLAFSVLKLQYVDGPGVTMSKNSPILSNCHIPQKWQDSGSSEFLGVPPQFESPSRMTGMGSPTSSEPCSHR